MGLLKIQCVRFKQHLTVGKHIANNDKVNSCFLMSHLISQVSCISYDVSHQTPNRPTSSQMDPLFR